MSTIASQITSLTIVYSTVYSSADQSKHQSSASLAFVWEIHRGPVNFPHKWPVTRKMFPFDDVIMKILGICFVATGTLRPKLWSAWKNVPFPCLNIRNTITSPSWNCAKMNWAKSKSKFHIGIPQSYILWRWNGLRWNGIMTSLNGTFSELIAICAGNSPVTGEFPTQRLMTRSYVVFFDMRLNKGLSKQSWSWWFDSPSHPLWRHCNGLCFFIL